MVMSSLKESLNDYLGSQSILATYVIASYIVASNLYGKRITCMFTGIFNCVCCLST